VLAGVAVLALLVGGGVGAGIGAGVADDQDRVDALSGDVDGLRDQLADSDTALDAAQARAEDAEAAVDGAVDEARAQVEEENAEQAADLDAREADLAAREAAVSQRESAAGALEQQAADGSIPGDGVYLVGTEVAPGTYRATSAGEYCYWERLSGLSGEFDDVITNGLGAADATVTVSGSDVAFSSDGCGSWQRIS
jgi:multidrug efflux pump subunit AcrA (membrane-fusion protein)